MTIYDVLRELVEKQIWPDEGTKLQRIEVINSAERNNIFGRTQQHFRHRREVRSHMTNVVMCDAESCGAFFGEGLEGSSTGVDIDPETGRQRALHYCDACTLRRKTVRSKLVFRPQTDVPTTPQIAERVQD